MNTSMSFTSNYRLLRHLPTGQPYTCRVEGVRITGCLGPLKPRWRPVVDLAALPYEENSELVRWANERLDKFDLAE